MLVGLNLLPLTLRDFRSWSYHQNITHLTFVEPLGLQNQLQCLVPGDILQTQGNSSGYCIARHQVQLGEIGNQLQYGTNLDVLKVQGYPVTHIAEFVLALINLFLGQGLYTDHILVVCLVRQVIKITGSLENQRRSPLSGINRHTVYRGGKIGHIVATHQALSHGGINELHIDVTRFTEHVHIHRRIR